MPKKKIGIKRKPKNGLGLKRKAIKIKKRGSRYA